MSRHTMNPVLKLVLGLLVAAGAVTILILAATGRLTFWTNWDIPGRADTVICSEEITEEITGLDVDWGSGTVVIMAGDEDRVLLVEMAAKEDVEPLLLFSVSDGLLSVKSADADGWAIEDWFTGERRLEITLPQKAYEQIAVHLESGSCILTGTQSVTLDVHAESGTLKLTGVQADDLIARITSGGFTGTDVAAGSVDMDITSGTAKLDGTLGRILARVGSGSADIQCAVLPEALDAHVTSGRLKIHIPENDGFTATVGVTSGRFDSDFDLSQMGGRYTYRAGGPEYNLSCQSGGVYLLRTEP